MKTMNMKNTVSDWSRIGLGIALFAAGATLAQRHFTGSHSQVPDPFGPLEAIPSALAATALNPSSFSDLSTSTQASQMTKWLYFLVNGPSADYTISGPSEGYVGIISGITEAFGQAIRNANLHGGTAGQQPDCTQILSTGSTTFSSGGASYALALASGTSTVPAHFQSRAGTTFGRMITVTRNSVPFAKLEFSCTSAEDYAGYLVLIQGGTDRDMEAYYERNVSTGAATVDFAMVNNDGSGEKTWTRFRTTGGDSFTLHMIRTTTSSDSHAFSVVGTRSSSKALIGGINVTNSTDATASSTALSASFPATPTCVDPSTDQVTTGCQSALATPSSGPLGAMTSGVSSYSVSAVSSMTLSTLAF